jgi:predicted acetyltransferase
MHSCGCWKISPRMTVRRGAYYTRVVGDFEAYVAGLLEQEIGVNLPPGYVPCSHRWLLNDEASLVGNVRIRHNVDTDFLATEAGHIGYDVPPSFRGLGYGTASLRAGIARSRELDLTHLLLFCDDDNLPSRRTIERCGGVHEATRHSEFFGCLVRRYSIEIAGG